MILAEGQEILTSFKYIFPINIMVMANISLAQVDSSFDDIVKSGDAAQVCVSSEGQCFANPSLLAELIYRRLGLDFGTLAEIHEKNPKIPAGDLPRAILLEASKGAPFYVDLEWIFESSSGGEYFDQKTIIINGRALFRDYLNELRSRLPDATYRIQKESIEADADASAILGPEPSLKIACLSAQESLLDSKLAKRLRLRGQIDDLANKRPNFGTSGKAVSKFNAIEPAKVAFVSDKEADQTTVSICLTAGYRLFEKTKVDNTEAGSVFRTLSVTPFTAYEITDIDGGTDEESDIHQITPGIQFGWESNDRWLGLVENIAVSFSGTLDEEQNARTLRARSQFDLNPTLPSNRKLNLSPSAGSYLDDQNLRGKTSYCFSNVIIGDGPVGMHCAPRALIELVSRLRNT